MLRTIVSSSWVELGKGVSLNAVRISRHRNGSPRNPHWFGSLSNSVASDFKLPSRWRLTPSWSRRMIRLILSANEKTGRQPTLIASKVSVGCLVLFQATLDHRLFGWMIWEFGRIFSMDISMEAYRNQKLTENLDSALPYKSGSLEAKPINLCSMRILQPRYVGC